jgi:hypothetical protein
VTNTSKEDDVQSEPTEQRDEDQAGQDLPKGVSRDPVKRARQLANLTPGVNRGPNWRGGIKTGYKFEVKYERNCVLCDRAFGAETTKQRFCSRACGAEAARLTRILRGDYRNGKGQGYRSVAQRLGAETNSGSAIARTLARAEVLRQPVPVQT